MDTTAAPQSSWYLGLYVPLAALGAYRLYLNWNRDRAAMALYTCIIVGSVCEVASMLLARPQDSSTTATIGDLFVVAAYLLIMYNWSVIAKRMDSLRTTTAPVAVVAYMAVSAFAYASDTVVLGVAVASRRTRPNNTSTYTTPIGFVCWLQVATQAGVAAVSALAIGLFPFYGHRMRNVLRRVGEDSPKRMRNIASIAATAALYFFCHAVDQVRSTLHRASTCTTDGALANSSPLWYLALTKPICVLLLLVFLPCKPAPTKAGYVRLGSTNA